MIKKNFLVLLLFFVLSGNLFSQNFWNTTVKKSTLTQQNNKIIDRENKPKKYSLASLDLNKFKNHLIKYNLNKRENTIILPNAEGNLEKFSFQETSSLAPKLAAKFPMIKTYSAQGIDNPSSVAKITLGIDGMHALIYSANQSTIYIDPYTADKKNYIIYKRNDLKADDNDFRCQTQNTVEEIKRSSIQKKNADDGRLRTYRIAIACTGEYAQFHLNNQGTADSATDAVKKSVILSAMNTTMARVNSVYERDLGVRMIIVEDNDELIFLDSATDGLTNDNANNLIDESQAKCDDIIGDENYDIGHTFSTGGGGLAARGVCITGIKGSGITGSSTPMNDPFDIDYVAHEIGHQFGAAHTFNGTSGNCSGTNRSTSTAVEPGSGSTIMAYAGICDPQNIQDNSDDYFHIISINQMWNYVQSVAACGVTTTTGNTAPTANAGSNMSIPRNTPFILKGIGTDAEGTESLTYNWEQVDLGEAAVPLVSTTTEGPAFRSLPSKTSPNRYFPPLSNVVSGEANAWEVLPSVARELNFALTVRDNNAGGGNTARDDVRITVTDSEPFAFTYPNSAVKWNVGSVQTLTWNKSDTDKAPINCKKVNIKLSIDGGLTFPIVLKDNIDNDGTEDIIIPNNATTQARILIEAVDNIFYNINNTDFTIDSSEPTIIVSNTSGKQIVCNKGTDSIDYTLKFDFINGFSETITLSASDLPDGTTATFSPATISATGDVIMTINNLNGTDQQDKTIVVQVKSTTITRKIKAPLTILGTDFTKVNLTVPANKTEDVSILPKLEWEANSNTTSYDIVVATDASFTNIVVSESVATNSYTLTTSLERLTNYFWYVKPKNKCGEGTNSDTFEFKTEVPEYCASTYLDETGGAEHIRNVTFNTINNDSENDSIDGYEDFTDISTNVRRGEEHQISITLDTAGGQDHCYVFIDWNQDYVFDEDTERYDLGAQTDNIATTTLNIEIPVDAVLGETTMRVIIEYYNTSLSSGNGPCNSDQASDFGETEDYSIEVLKKPDPDFTITNTTGNLSICNKAVNEQVFAIDYNALFGFTESVTLSVSGIPTNATSSLSPITITESGLVNLTISNLNKTPVGDYKMIVTGVSSSLTKSIEIPFNVSDNTCNSSGNTDSQISTTLVNFGEINNISTKTTGYSDFKTIASEVIKGEKYPLVVNVNSDGTKIVETYAWIDWNQNCLFEDDEQYDLGTTASTSGPTANSGLEIMVPSSALVGSTILRVVTKLSSAGSPVSCELDFDGEVEDYTITITPSFILTNKTPALSICNKAVNQVQYIIDYKTLNDFGEDITLSAENTPAGTTTTFSSPVTDDKGITTITATISNLNSAIFGDYAIKVTATSSVTKLAKSTNLTLIINDNHCKSSGNTDSNISITNVSFGEINNTSAKTTGYSDFKTMTARVVRGESYNLNINVNTDGNKVKTYAWIDWNQNCEFEATEAYDLTSKTSVIQVPQGAILGTTTLRISTKINEFAESCEINFDGEVEDYTINTEESFATDKNLFSDLKIYPIPSDGKLTVNFKVKVKDLTIIRLFDTTGQLVVTQKFSTVSSKFNNEIDFTKISSGIYFLQIENDGKINTNKIIIK